MLCLVEFRLIRVFIARLVLPAAFTLLLFLAFLTHGLLALARGGTLDAPPQALFRAVPWFSQRGADL